MRLQNKTKPDHQRMCNHDDSCQIWGTFQKFGLCPTKNNGAIEKQCSIGIFIPEIPFQRLKALVMRGCAFQAIQNKQLTRVVTKRALPSHSWNPIVLMQIMTSSQHLFSQLTHREFIMPVFVCCHSILSTFLKSACSKQLLHR